jgi:hypothetical protein
MALNKIYLLTDDTGHSYPFDTLPLIESHLHPKFAIFAAGMHLVNLDPASDLHQNIWKDNPGFSIIVGLYRAWTQKVADRQKQDPSYCNNDAFQVPFDYGIGDDYFGVRNGDDGDDDKDGDYSDRRTQPGRIAKPRELPLLDAYKHKLRSMGKVTSSYTRNQQMLSKMTLYSHTRQCGQAAWTADRILDWSNQSAPFPKKRKIWHGQKPFRVLPLV